MRRQDFVCFLVRHGDAGDKSVWRGPDADRPLSALGRRTAAGLVIRLEDFPIRRILSSPALRCTQTVRPLAERNRLGVEHHDLLRVGADAAALAAFVRSRAADMAVLCTHGEVLADILPILTAAGTMVIGSQAWPKGGICILDGVVGGPMRARYLRPLEWPPGAPTGASPETLSRHI